MCARFSLTSPADLLARFFGLVSIPDIVARFNIAPTQTTPVILRDPTPGGSGERRARLHRFGLVPSWAKDVKIGPRLINARSETIFDKPSFRAAVRRRRCLVPTDGFYEWTTEGRAKLPILFRRPNAEPFAFAGIWETWTRGDEPIHSFSIITTDANRTIAPVHHRMPVVLDPSDFDRWLSPDLDDDAISALLRPAPEDALAAHRVSTRVNDVRNEGPECWAPRED